MQGLDGERFAPPPPKKNPLFPPSLNNVTRYTLETVPFNFLHATGTQQL